MNQLSYKIMLASDVPDGTMKTIVVGEETVALAHVGDSFFAVSDICTHSECSLGTDGYVDGKTVMCGCHGATFDLTNGKALSLPATVDLKTYVVEIIDGWIYLKQKCI